MQFGSLSQESLETENCQTQFDQLVKTFGNNYDSCFAERKKAIDCSANVTPPKLNIAVIFDASGSMGAKIGNETMMKIAQDELGKYISSLDESIG